MKPQSHDIARAPMNGHRRVGVAMRLSALALAVALAPAVANANPAGWLWGKSDSSSSTDGAQQNAPTNQTVAQAQPEQNPSGQAVVIQNLLNQVQQMQQDMRTLRGKLEVQSNEIDRLKSAQRDGFAALDSRMNKLEQAGAANAPAGAAGSDQGQGTAPSSPQSAAPSAPSSPSVNAPATPSAPAQPSTSTGGNAQAPSATASASAGASAGAAATQPKPDPAKAAQQQKLYNKAFGLLKDGKYDGAIQAFQAVIDADPQGTWTPSALFWQGETYYVEQKRKQAAAAYQKIISDFPKSGRVPDALLKTGYIAYDLNQNPKARSIFKQVISQYPNSQAANLAKARLERMDREHR